MVIPQKGEKNFVTGYIIQIDNCSREEFKTKI
jgi:hypothetical protein